MRKLIAAMVGLTGFVILSGALTACTPDVRQDVNVTQSASPDNSSNSNSSFGIDVVI